MTVNFSGAFQNALRSGAALGAYKNLVSQTDPFSPKAVAKADAAAQKAGYPDSDAQKTEEMKAEFDAQERLAYAAGANNEYALHENDNEDLSAKAAQTATARGVQAVAQTASQKARMTEYYQNLVSQRFGSLSETERAKSTRSGWINK
ncbi:MAG: hypothetical protein MJ053_07145 [Elusimicrobiaceae bacterium]|nr:hypothetical protein [Elusimicrobiaceae bacterium]